MKLSTSILGCCYFVLNVVLFSCCKSDFSGNIQLVNRYPEISPDYIEVTIPKNIAPLNFKIDESGNYYQVRVKSARGKEEFVLNSSDGIIQFPEKSWKELLEKSKGGKIIVEVLSANSDKKVYKYNPFSIVVAEYLIDPVLAYRLIYPGYYSWSDIKIEQRSLETFERKSVVENQVIEKNCVNCHSFRQNDPNQFLIHMRGSKGGTYFSKGGKLIKTNLKTEKMLSGATYPYWHPGGRFVVFSSNIVKQSFYAQHSKSIEVYDQASSLILYDVEKNEIIGVPEDDQKEKLQTFPTWSPDGKTLYYCEASLSDSAKNWDISEIKSIHYNLVKKSFDETSVSFGKKEMVVDGQSMQKSVSFPRISPDGKFLVFTMADYGTFPIWHKEADLYILDLLNGNMKKMEINSAETDSYHSWSSNGKWLVFSSKRMDGRSTRPYIAYVNSWNQIGKPFALPQQDPTYYDKLVQSYNIPEMVKGEIRLTPRDFADATDKPVIQAKVGKNESAVTAKFGSPIATQQEISNSAHE